MHIKRLSEYVNYSDDLVNKIPKVLSEDENDFDIDLDYLSPELLTKFREIMFLLQDDDNDDKISNILWSLSRDDQEILQYAIDSASNYVTNIFKYKAKQN